MTAVNQELLETVIKAADDKKAEDIMAMDVRSISLLADHFVVMHGNNERQVAAIAEAVVESAQKAGYNVHHVEGKDNAKWVLIDLGDVIVHVFHYTERSFYNLEKLWSDAPLVDISGMISA